MNLLFRDTAGPTLAPGGSVLCVGAFDGVHLGHRALLARVRERAAERGLVPLAISFEPIPRELFARGAPVPRLASAREKIERVAAAGIERLLLLRFNTVLAALEAEAFIERVLVARCAAREIWIGADFRFGHGRRGDVAMLREASARLGFTVEVMPDVEIAGERVSSSTVRAHLAAGEFDAAARLLGRPFSIGGHVVRGQQLGRKLGYPTANIRLGRRTSPVGGIFAVQVHGAAAEALPGVASLGVRPTVNGTEPLLEAHLFDFDGDLYGRRLEVEFVQKLRDEAKFDDLDAMVRQIDRDADEARAILADRRPGAGQDPVPLPAIEEVRSLPVPG
ncbi:MAG: bifunctional riboflavin kinase/FAD synthetase [Rhodanobacteraceae bacterium]|jgi:riboflavin kinase/FMN adenylyltransferase|nr:bifunctional riboflavin kinase/FAD synthetase [Rhodanobacteraceae bacterium]